MSEPDSDNDETVDFADLALGVFPSTSAGLSEPFKTVDRPFRTIEPTSELVEIREPTAQKVPKPSDSRINTAVSSLMAEKSTDGAKLKYSKVCLQYIMDLEVFINSSSSTINADGVIINLEERRSLCKLCEAVLTTSSSAAFKNDLELRLWKTGFYSAVEKIRKFQSSLGTNSNLSTTAKASWASLIGTGVQSFSRIIVSLHDQSIKPSSKQSPSIPAYGRFFGWLGDLARYRTMFGIEFLPDFGPFPLRVLGEWTDPQKMYSIASFLAPSNGLYFNQLAAIDLNDGNILGALYNYVRALAVKVPLQTAQESIVSLFAYSKRFHQDALQTTKPKTGKGTSASKKRKNSQSTAEHIALRCFEFLFTKINLDSLNDFLSLLESSLNEQDQNLPARFYEKTAIISLFLLSNINTSSSIDVENGTTRLTCILLTSCAKTAANAVNETASDSLTALRLFFTYFSSSHAMKFLSSQHRVASLEPAWNALLQMDVKVGSKSKKNETLLLQEDWNYRGFDPFRHTLDRRMFDEQVTFMKEKSLVVLYETFQGGVKLNDHMDAIKEQLSGLLMSLDFVDVIDGKFQFTGNLNQGTKKPLNEAPVRSSVATDHESSSMNINLESLILVDDSSDIQDLKVGHPFRHVKSIISLLSNNWTIVLPLAVVTELDGLAVGDRLSEQAKSALELINPLVASRDAKPENLMLVTFRGTQLPFLMARTEAWGSASDSDVRGVDDSLVNCAKDIAVHFAKAGKLGKKIVVLITADVNLRLKASGAGVLTGSIDDLKKWIGKKEFS
ncbi:Smg-6, nonsense mediated mRNA decay factor [Entophlyctis luteolus]|nr:Smg-6, nonsense mediated mRNA decay factor [Entophlyctis luteolus]